MLQHLYHFSAYTCQSFLPAKAILQKKTFIMLFHEFSRKKKKNASNDCNIFKKLSC